MIHVIYFLFGIILGIANIIPGVSGGTMAVLLGIYDKLIGAVSHFRKNIKQNVIFLIPILLGAGTGILALAKLITFLLERYPMQVNFFFAGLILGSVPMIIREANYQSKKLTAGAAIGFIAALAGMLALVFFGPEKDSGSAVTQLDIWLAVQLVIYGAIAAACMIIPGVSGSMMLVIFGVYTTITTAVSELNIMILIPAGIGIVIGLIGGAKLIDICLNRFRKITYFVILGLIAGSLAGVFKESGFEFGLSGFISTVIMIAGAAAAYYLSGEKFRAFCEKLAARSKNN